MKKRGVCQGHWMQKDYLGKAQQLRSGHVYRKYFGIFFVAMSDLPWRVDHIPTGFYVGRFANEQDAFDAVDILNAWGMNWNLRQYEKFDSRDLIRYGKILIKFTNRVLPSVGRRICCD